MASTADVPEKGSRIPSDLPPEGVQRFFGEVFSLWVTPEVERRQEAGDAPKPFQLWAAQVIFRSERGRPEIRLNEEVRVRAKARLKKDGTKELGGPVFLSDIDDINDFRLLQEEDKDCAHITLMRLQDSWVIAFDARYNKDLSRRHLARAREFLQAAELCFGQENWPPFVDNLFSAAELMAKATLLVIPDEKLLRRPRHRHIQGKYNAWARIGNVDVSFRDALNRLAGLRDKARYVKGEFTLTKTGARELLDTVKTMLADAERAYS